MKLMKKTALALLMTTALILPAAALDISIGDRNNDRGGVGASVGGDGVDARAGNTGASVGIDNDNDGIGVDANVGDATAKGTLLGPSGAASATLNSSALNGINARLDVLSTESLATLCVDIGGGAGCNSGDRSELLGLIQAEIGALTGDQLASLCVSVGGSGCGGGAGGPGGPGDPGGPGVGGGGGVPDAIGNLSRAERDALKNRCSDITRQPGKYDAELIQLCRLLAQI